MMTKIEIGKSYLFTSRDTKAWGDFSASVSGDLTVSPTDILNFSPNDGVEALRKTIASFSLKPHSSPCRILFITNGEALNSEQANTLLKTLEEPPGYGLIVIFSSNASKILTTIKSRCIRIWSDGEKPDTGDSAFIESLELDFSEFLLHFKNIESSEIPDMLILSLRQIKRRGMSTLNIDLYKKIANTLLRISSSNSNPRLALEEIYIWYKARAEK